MKEDKLLKITLDDLIRYAAPEAVKLIEQEYEKDPEFKLKLSSKLVTKKPGMRPCISRVSEAKCEPFRPGQFLRNFLCYKNSLYELF